MSAIEIVGLSNLIKIQPTLSASGTAYSANDQVGGIQTLSGAFRPATRSFAGSRIVLQSITVVDLNAQSANLQVLFFNSLPTVASTDNATLNISDAEMGSKCVGYVAIDSTYGTTSANSVTSKTGIGLVMDQGTDPQNFNLYAVMKTSGTPTYNTDSLRIEYGFLQD